MAGNMFSHATRLSIIAAVGMLSACGSDKPFEPKDSEDSHRHCQASAPSEGGGPAMGFINNCVRELCQKYPAKCPA